MSCSKCREGAKLAVENRDDEGIVAAAIRAAVKALHDLCSGCMCQHKMDKMLND